MMIDDTARCYYVTLLGKVFVTPKNRENDSPNLPLFAEVSAVVLP